MMVFFDSQIMKKPLIGWSRNFYFTFKKMNFGDNPSCERYVTRKSNRAVTKSCNHAGSKITKKKHSTYSQEISKSDTKEFVILVLPTMLFVVQVSSLAITKNNVIIFTGDNLSRTEKNYSNHEKKRK